MQDIQTTLTYKETCDKRNKILLRYTVVLLLWPILNSYGFVVQNIGLGDVFIIPYSIYAYSVLCGFSYKIKIRNSYFLFELFYLFMTFFSYIVMSVSFSNGVIGTTLKDFVYVVCFAVFAPKLIDLRLLLSIYKKISLFLCFIILLQWLLYLLFRISNPWMLNIGFLPIKDIDSYDEFLKSWYYYLSYNGFRPSALFSEPSKLSLYLSPCLVLMLLSEGKKAFKHSVFFSICICLTRSANGVAFCFVAWCSWVIFDKTVVNRFAKALAAIGAFLSLLFTSLTGFLKNNWFFSRLSEVGASQINSGNMRVLRGWMIFDQLPIYNKIFGVGIGNIINFINTHRISTPYDGGYLGYMSGLSEIAVTGGIVCFAFFLIYILRSFIQSDSISKGVILLLVTMLFSSAILNEPIFGLCITILENYNFRNIISSEEHF